MARAALSKGHKKRLTDELSSISQRLRVIVSDVLKSSDMDILGAYPELSRASQYITDAKIQIRKQDILKKVAKEAKGEMKSNAPRKAGRPRKTKA